MIVADNVAFGLKVRPRATRPASAEIRRCAHELLDLVQLSNLSERYPNQLSGGQRQRVALARALAIEPAVLLLDEPFGAFDAQVRRELRRWLRELHDATRHTTVFVTHDQEEALELADRVVLMNQGHIEQIGSADEIYDHPKSPFVFGFIGESASLTVHIRGGRIWLHDHATGLAIAAPDGEAALYFLPHDIEVTEGHGDCIVGTVIASRRVAEIRHLELEIDVFPHPVEIALSAENPAAMRSRIAFRPTRWCVFSAGWRREAGFRHLNTPSPECRPG